MSKTLKEDDLKALAADRTTALRAFEAEAASYEAACVRVNEAKDALRQAEFDLGIAANRFQEAKKALTVHLHGPMQDSYGGYLMADAKVIENRPASIAFPSGCPVED